MAKPVLMIAFHFPPARASGVQRTLSFSQHLPKFGWQPLVLSAHSLAYEHKDWDQMADVPPSLPVTRAIALDAARHLAIAGRYARFTALPDRWSSWWLAAIPLGLAMIRRYRPRVIWSTYPLATALNIGLTLHRLTGIPWVTDFRDPMVLGRHPPDLVVRKQFQQLEKQAVSRCSHVVVTTPGIRGVLSARYPELPPDHWSVVANGYDETLFAEIEKGLPSPDPAPDPITLLHSGVLYSGPEERDPTPFLNALAHLKKGGVLGPKTRPGLRVILRATGRNVEISKLIQEKGLAAIVITGEPLPYRQALREMFQVDGLLLFQGADFDHMIPAKLFEYLRTRRPILALTGTHGDSARVMRAAGLSTIVPLRDENAIIQALTTLLQQIQTDQTPCPTSKTILQHSRQARTRELAAVFDRLVSV